MKTAIVITIALLLGIGLLVAGCAATRGGYASAPYKVVKKDSGIELRDYPKLVLVETSTSPSGDGADGSFNRLFRFITGRNEGSQKISMTTPVFMSGGDTNRSMAFVMPSALKPTDVPKPSDGAVSIREVPEGRFAVLRFKGGRSSEREMETLSRLKAWISSQGLQSEEAPVYGYFDPPWTPGFLRRNEVMLRIKGGA
jgi:hypothetical protein